MATQQQALPADAGGENPLYRPAVEVEGDEQLAAEMAEWDAAIDDGLEAISEEDPGYAEAGSGAG